MNPIRLAAVAPFTGPRAGWGRLLRDAAARAADPATEVVFLDDRGDPDLAGQRAEEIVAAGGFRAVIGHFSSLGAARAIPIYRAAGLPLILPLATRSGLLTGSDGWVLRWCPDDAAQATAIAAALQTRRHRAWTVRDDGTAYGRYLAEVVERARPAAAGPPTATVLCGAHHGVAALVRDLHGLQFVFTDDCDIPEFADLVGPAGHGGLVAGLAGGPARYVDEALRALVAAVTGVDRPAGTDLVRALRAISGHTFTPDGDRADPAAAWRLSPVRRPSRAVAPTRSAAHPTDRFDVAVVGAGIVGAGAAVRLAESGASVVLLDQGPGATQYSGALVRAYEPDPVMRALAITSSRLVWRTRSASREYGFRRTGSIVLLGAGDLDTAHSAIDEMAAVGIPARLMDPDEIAHRWPSMSVAGIAGGVWEPAGGYAAPEITVGTLLGRAVRGHAVHLPGRRAERLEPAPDGTTILHSDRGRLGARVVVVAAGAGSPALLGDRLPDRAQSRTKRISYGFFAYAGPPLPAVVDLVTGVWGRPDRPGVYLAGAPVDDWDTPVTGGDDLWPGRADRIRTDTVARWPWLAAAEVVGGRHGVDLYPGGGPILDVWREGSPVVAAAGWSGGGFKTGPAASEWAARTALDLLTGAA